MRSRNEVPGRSTSAAIRKPGTGLRTVELVTLAATLGGCAEILDIPDAPKLVGPWRCLEKPAPAPAPEQASALVRVHACNFVSNNCSEPVTNLNAELCNKRDVDCSRPLGATLRDMGGEFLFEVPTGGTLADGFDGYLQVRSPTAPCTDERAFGETARMLCGIAPGCDPAAPSAACELPTFAPSLLFFNPPITRDLADPLVLPLIPTAAVPRLTLAVNRTLDPTTANVFITALDCDGKPAAGVRLRIMQHQDVATVLYVHAGVVSADATETDASGIGGFLGVPPGFVSVAATIQGVTDPREEVVIGEVGLQAAPFTISYGTLAPGG